MNGRIAVVAVAVLLGGLLVGCSDEPYYRTCKEAQAAGVQLPLTPNSPGWNPKLDRDRDGKDRMRALCRAADPEVPVDADEVRAQFQASRDRLRAKVPTAPFKIVVELVRTEAAS